MNVTVAMLRAARMLIDEQRVVGPLMFYVSEEAYAEAAGVTFDGRGPDGTWAYPHTTQATRLPGHW